MRVCSVFLAAVAAVPLVTALPQGIDFAAVQDAAESAVQGAPVVGGHEAPTYDPADAASSAAAAAIATPVAAGIQKRAVTTPSACAPQPSGFAPPTSPDRVQYFLANKNYTSIAMGADVPQGYQQVFQNLHGATEQNGYLGYYDTIQCQQYCDAVSTCTAFNIYIERQPSKWPAKKCPNPPSTAAYKCSLYGLPICNDTATNVGQYMKQFHVVVAASNGYVKNAPPPANTNFTGPTGMGGAISAPAGDTSYIGMRLYPGPYDPGQCAATCQATTAYDSQNLVGADGTYAACNFFNSYVLSVNNVPQGTYCMFFTRPWDGSYATNVGQYDNQGNYYSVSSSYAYTLDPQDPGVVPTS